MEKALFLLQDWLAVGTAVVVFTGIGLLVGKWIWGRQGVRLSRAVDENMNLLSQWAALGQTQHSLFKKLRNRWQADRDSWAEQVAVWSEQLRGKDKAIRKLIDKVKQMKEVESLPLNADAEVTGEDFSEEIASLKEQIKKGNNEIKDAHAEMEDVRNGYLARGRMIDSLESRLSSVAASAGASGEILEASNLQLAALLRQRAIETARLRPLVASASVDPAVEEAALKESAQLRRQLDETVNELADARGLFEDKSGEIRILKSRLKDIQIADAGRNRDGARNESAIADLQDELGDVRKGYRAKAKEIDVLKGQAEELESIIEDRNREIEDAGEELKRQLNVISGLRSSIAELEGELDGQDVESVDLVAELEEKSGQVAYLNGRMKELEEAMAERYGEVNRVRAEWSQIDERAGKFERESEKLGEEVVEQSTEIIRLGVEVKEKVAEMKPLKQRLRELSDELKEARSVGKDVRAELEEKELNLAVAEEGASRLRESLNGKNSELEKAQSDLLALKSELEEQAKIDENRKAELDDALTRLDEYDRDLAQRDKSITGMEETVDRIEAEADSLKILLEEGRRNTADLESRIIEFEDLIQSKNSEIGVFTHEIRNLVESVEGSEPDSGGGNRTSELDRLLADSSENVVGDTTKVHIRILSDTVADLQNRLVEAEGSYGACEREKALMNEKSAGVRDQFEMELMSRDKQIQILKHEVSAQQAKLEVLREKAAEADAVAAVTIGTERAAAEDELVVVDVANEIRGGRNTSPVSDSKPASDKSKRSGGKIWLSIHFDEKSFELKSSEISKIDDAARNIKEAGVPFRVSVAGFSSAEGSSDFNEFLSARRADSVRERLIDLGVAQSTIATQGQGKHPEYRSSPNNWKARRVEISFVSEAVAEAVS